MAFLPDVYGIWFSELPSPALVLTGTYADFLFCSKTSKWCDFYSDLPIWFFFSNSEKSSFCYLPSWVPIGKQNTDYEVSKPPSWPESVVALMHWCPRLPLAGKKILFQCWCLSNNSSCCLSKRYRFFSFNSLQRDCWYDGPGVPGRLNEEICWEVCNCWNAPWEDWWSCRGAPCTCCWPPPYELLLLLFVVLFYVLINGLALIWSWVLAIVDFCCTFWL